MPPPLLNKFMEQFSIPLTQLISVSLLHNTSSPRIAIDTILSDPAAGASDDWYMSWLDSYRYGQETKRGKAYTYELRDTGRYGFVLPEEQIRPSGEEAWAAVSVMLQDVVDNSKM